MYKLDKLPAKYTDQSIFAPLLIFSLLWGAGELWASGVVGTIVAFVGYKNAEYYWNRWKGKASKGGQKTNLGRLWWRVIVFSILLGVLFAVGQSWAGGVMLAALFLAGWKTTKIVWDPDGDYWPKEPRTPFRMTGGMIVRVFWVPLGAFLAGWFSLAYFGGFNRWTTIALVPGFAIVLLHIGHSLRRLEPQSVRAARWVLFVVFIWCMAPIILLAIAIDMDARKPPGGLSPKEEAIRRANEVTEFDETGRAIWYETE